VCTERILEDYRLSRECLPFYAFLLAPLEDYRLSRECIPFYAFLLAPNVMIT
jgi:hypothetical protein